MRLNARPLTLVYANIFFVPSFSNKLLLFVCCLFAYCQDSGFTTEVYHVTGNGEDAGVVYSEMLSRETGGDDRSYLAVQRALYPPGCGYRYETGGMLDNLRNSTNNAKVGCSQLNVTNREWEGQ